MPKKASPRKKKIESVNAPKLQASEAQIKKTTPETPAAVALTPEKSVATPATPDTQSKTSVKKSIPSFTPSPIDEQPDVFTAPEADFVNPPLNTGMRDIKPKAGSNNADFLAPEHTTFGLKTNSVGGGHWLRNLIYSLVGIIILSILAYGLLAWYSARTLHNETSDLIQVPAQTDTSGNNTATQTAQSFEVSTDNQQLKDLLAASISNTLGSGFTNLTAGTAAAKSVLPALTTDAVLYAKDQQQVGQQVLQALTTLGVNAQLQENDSLASTVLVYLTSTIQSPTLTGSVATVYNASGVTGVAKSFCKILLTAKVTSCTPSNATTTQTGMTVLYKQQKLLFTLARINELKAAQFTQADANQVEDIKVTLGK